MDPRLLLLGGSFQIVIQRNFKVHQFVSFGVRNAGDINICAGQRRINISHVEKQETGLRSMRLDRSRLKLRRIDLVHLFLADTRLHRLARNGKRIGPGIGLRIGELAVKVFHGYRRKFRSIGRDQRDFHASDGNGLIAVIGDDKKNGQAAMVFEIGRKNPGLFRRVIGVSGDADFFVAMHIVRGIFAGSFRNRLHKALARHHQWCERKSAQGNDRQTAGYARRCEQRSNTHRRNYKTGADAAQFNRRARRG